MKALVTGGAGFIGLHLTEALLARGHDVRVLDALTQPVHEPDAPSPTPPEVEFIHGDVADAATLLRALDGCDIVFHLAAYQDYLPDFSRFFHVNTEATALLYELIVRESLPVQRVVFASSQAVYGEAAARCPEHGAQFPQAREQAALDRGEWDNPCPHCAKPLEPVATSEDAPLRPHNAYGISKRAQEEVALTLGRRYGVPTVALRYSIVIGPRQSFRNAYSGAVRSFTMRLLNGRPPVIFEDGEQLRDFVHVDDVVSAMLLTSEDDRAVFRAFNVASGQPVTLLEVARLVADVAGSDVSPELSGEYRQGDTRHAWSNIEQLTALGWSPAASFRQAVEDYVAWVREQDDVLDAFEESASRMRALGVLRPSSSL